MTRLTKSIIIEGPNGAGKSTLAKELSEYFGIEVVHATKPDNSTDAYTKAMEQLLKSFSVMIGEEPVIYDRSHSLSRLVYQKDVISEYEGDVHAYIFGVQSQICHTIYCVGQGERDMNKPHYTEELKEETKDQKKIRESYTLVMSNIPNIIEYDFNTQDIEYVLSKLNVI